MRLRDAPKLNAGITMDFASVVQPDPVYQELLREIELLRAENQRLWEIIEERYPGCDDRESHPLSSNGLTEGTVRPAATNGASRLRTMAAQPGAGPAAAGEGAKVDPVVVELQAVRAEQDNSIRQQEQLQQAQREIGDELARLREELEAYVEQQDAPATWYQYCVPADLSTDQARTGISSGRIVRGLIWFSVVLTILLIALLSYELASSANLF